MGSTSTDTEKASKIAQRLRNLGLSEKEIETYLTLLELGSGTAKEIADESDVSQRYVYNIAETLENRGLVKVHNYAEPTMIEAEPPTEAIDRLVNELTSLESQLSQRYNESSDEPIAFDVVKSRQTAIKQIRSLLSTAETEVLLMIPRSVVDSVATELRDAVDRRVTVLLLEIPSQNGGLSTSASRYDGLATVVRHWDQQAPFVMTVDGTSGIVGDYELISSDKLDSVSVSLTEPHLTGALFGSFVDSLWSIGTEVYVDDPMGLPLTREKIRPIAIQAHLHLQRDDTIYATVDAVPTEGTEPKTLSGRVTGVTQALVEPENASFSVECSLEIETEDGRVSVGGDGAFLEMYEANELTLHT